MKVDIDSFKKLSITDIDINDMEIISIALTRILNDLTSYEQVRFQSLLIKIDWLLPNIAVEHD